MARESTNKTQATTVAVDDFLAGLDNEQRRTDAQALCTIMSRVTGEPPVMWGSAIIGFGQYHYKYDSGREGDMAAASFSPRAASLTLYLSGGFADDTDLLDALGPHKVKGSCLHIKRLADVATPVLETLIANSYRYVKENHDTTGHG